VPVRSDLPSLSTLFVLQSFMSVTHMSPLFFGYISCDLSRWYLLPLADLINIALSAHDYLQSRLKSVSSLASFLGGEGSLALTIRILE
jgi:hypothetical protein